MFKCLMAGQVLVNTYGLPRYQEANPALFTIATLHWNRNRCCSTLSTCPSGLLYRLVAAKEPEGIGSSDFDSHSRGHLSLSVRCHVRRRWPRANAALCGNLCGSVADTTGGDMPMSIERRYCLLKRTWGKLKV